MAMIAFASSCFAEVFMFLGERLMCAYRRD
jgi:hypothetical protein